MLGDQQVFGQVVVFVEFDVDYVEQVCGLFQFGQVQVVFVGGGFDWEIDEFYVLFVVLCEGLFQQYYVVGYQCCQEWFDCCWGEVLVGIYVQLYVGLCCVYGLYMFGVECGIIGEFEFQGLG